MNRVVIARLALFLLIAGGFAFAVWQLLETAPKSSRERPPAPKALVDVVATRAERHAVDARRGAPMSCRIRRAHGVEEGPSDPVGVRHDSG